MRHAARQMGAIALLAVLVRAIVPGGYMLASADTPEGRYLIVQLCDAHAGAPKAINLDTGEEVDVADISKHAPQENKAGHPPCVFATAPGMALPLLVAEPARTLIQHDADFAVVASVSPGRGIAAPPPPSTGPPAAV